ncbi:hypothetical protein [Geminocystis sp. NIES-3709]|uniref:hypothetical protein n=1 Tax=Geminocystis sp. NIES-3709 TaxID=1617448 RepID=UPI0008261618|nr:hypothetical protein [Geminocystis sp. NIES-3709]
MTIITVKRSEIPPMTEERMKEIEAMSDEDIDYSDIPELDDEWFKKAKLVDYSKGESFKSLAKTK